jgi:hypothetical protein
MTRTRFLGLALLCLLPGAARAEIAWTYDFTPGTTVVWSDNSNSKLNLSNQSSYMAVGSSDVVATSIGVDSSASDAHPDTFTNKDYTLSMKLTDVASGVFTTLNFTGQFNGTVSAHSANITNQFIGPTTYSNIMLGQNRYNVTITGYTPPGPVGGLSGSIGAHALVTVGDGQGGGPHGTPEPASLILAGLGIGGLGLASWRRKRD